MHLTDTLINLVELHWVLSCYNPIRSNESTLHIPIFSQLVYNFPLLAELEASFSSF